MYTVTEQNVAQFLAECSRLPNPLTHQPHARGLKRPDPSKARFGWLKYAKPMADVSLIPREQWPDLIAQRDREKSWAVDRMQNEVACVDQNPLGYCWIACCIEAFMVARNVQGHPFIDLSFTSAGGPITGWRNVGGWPQDGIRHLAEVGCCRMSKTSGRTSLNPNNWAADWKADCANFRIGEWDDGSFSSAAQRWDAQISLALAGRVYTVEFDWWGHAIAAGFKVRNNGGKIELLMRNNWGQWGETVNGGTGYVWMQEGVNAGTSDAVYAPRLVTPYDG